MSSTPIRRSSASFCSSLTASSFWLFSALVAPISRAASNLPLSISTAIMLLKPMALAIEMAFKPSPPQPIMAIHSSERRAPIFSRALKTVIPEHACGTTSAASKPSISTRNLSCSTKQCVAKPPFCFNPMMRIVAQSLSRSSLQASHSPQPIQGKTKTC